MPACFNMRKLYLFISSVLLLLFTCLACSSGIPGGDGAIPIDSATLARGEASFNKNCSGCHNFRQDGIGPQLVGLTTKVPVEWIHHFIKDPQKVINSGDKRAQQLYKKYKVFMPSFAALNDDELNS